MMIESQLTVVTPTRGSRPDLLAQCVRSVKEEGLDVLLEHIVVVDGDPKPIENEIANGDLSHDKLTIRGRKEAIPGANQCRNEGLSACECDYVLFLDDDDILARGALKRRLEFAAEHPKNDFWIFGSYMFRDQPGDCNFYHCFPEETNREDLERFLLMDQPWITTGPLWRRGFLREIGGWNTVLPRWQDWELNVRALLAEPRYVRAPWSDSYVRVHRENVSRRALQPTELRVIFSEVTALLEKILTARPNLRDHCATTAKVLGDYAIYAKDSQTFKDAWNLVDEFLGGSESCPSKAELFLYRLSLTQTPFPYLFHQGERLM